MRAVVLKALNDFSVETIPIPVPAAGEVLIRVESSPINPSDIVFLKGSYGTTKPLPVVPGFEGSGVVVSSGGGLVAWRLVGKRVAVSSLKGNGLWAEFIVAPATHCVVLPNDVSFNLGSCFFANPFTVMMFAETISTGKHKAVIQTAACSAVGKMLLRYCMSENIPIINIVRREEQVKMLEELGAKYVLNSNNKAFPLYIEQMCADIKPTVAFDCVSGEMTGILMEFMPEDSVVYVYGSLDRQPVQQVNPSALIFKGKKIEGLWLSKWIKSKSLYAKWSLGNRVGALLNTLLKTDISKEFKLEDIGSALKYYKGNMSEGKVILKPNLRE